MEKIASAETLTRDQEALERAIEKALENNGADGAQERKALKDAADKARAAGDDMRAGRESSDNAKKSCGLAEEGRQGDEGESQDGAKPDAKGRTAKEREAQAKAREDMAARAQALADELKKLADEAQTKKAGASAMAKGCREGRASVRAHDDELVLAAVGQVDDDLGRVAILEPREHLDVDLVLGLLEQSLHVLAGPAADELAERLSAPGYRQWHLRVELTRYLPDVQQVQRRAPDAREPRSMAERSGRALRKVDRNEDLADLFHGDSSTPKRCNAHARMSDREGGEEAPGASQASARATRGWA